jgi:hypothetical protein
MVVMRGVLARVCPAAGAALLAVPSLSVIHAHADVGVSYLGGCTVVVEVTSLNNTCDFTNLASDTETLVYEGSGTVTVADISGCGTGTTTLSPGTHSLSNEIGGCTYQVSVTNGVAIAADSNVLGLGYCFTVTPPPPPTLTSVDCNYVAISPAGSGGIAVGVALSTAPMTYSITVTDETTSTFVTVKTCTASGFGVLTQECPFPEQVGHIYYDTVTVTSGSALDLGVVGVG